jgi:hypothetical protein
VGDASPATGVGADFSAVLTGARAGADWAWTRLHRVLAAPVLAYLQAHHAPDAEFSLGTVFKQLAEDIGDFSGDEDALRLKALRLARRELDSWARVLGARGDRRGPTVTQLEGLPAVSEELERRHVAAAVALRRGVEGLRVDVRAPQPPRRRSQLLLPRGR